MRTLEKNKRLIHYSTYIKSIPIVDEWGNDTLEVEKEYSEPKELKINYSVNIGQDDTGAFGNFTDYDRTMVFIGECPLKESDLIWIGKPVNEKANYEVKKIADSLNSFVIAIKEIL